MTHKVDFAKDILCKTIKQLLEKSTIENTEVYVGFLDLKKAFGRVSQAMIIEKLTFI